MHLMTIARQYETFAIITNGLRATVGKRKKKIFKRQLVQMSTLRFVTDILAKNDICGVAV
jgi:hypothetical protein